MLTEWKLVQGQSEVEAKITEAQRQARHYAGSTLAGFELTSRRYLVLVSARRLSLPAGSSEDGIEYEHVGIAVDPEKPSQESRRA